MSLCPYRFVFNGCDRRKEIDNRYTPSAFIQGDWP